MDWADLWDLVWCPGDLGFPLSFGSREEALASGCASLQPIETTLCPCGTYDDEGKCTCPEQSCLVDNRQGSGDSAMVCTVGGDEYSSGESMLKGLSFATGEPENPPSSPMTYWDNWSFAWGVNVMNDYSRFNAHLWDPGRFSASQIDLVRGHTTHEVPIVADYAPFTNLTSGRTKLGVDVKDYEWWSNGDFTFSRVISPILDDDRVPIAGDFDADGADDIFWYRPGTAPDSIWWSNGDRTWQGASTTVNNVYTPVSGDFDGDGDDDIVWDSRSSIDDDLWIGDRTRDFGKNRFSVYDGFLAVVGKFDRDAASDVFWYHR